MSFSFGNWLFSCWLFLVFILISQNWYRPMTFVLSWCFLLLNNMESCNIDGSPMVRISFWLFLSEYLPVWLSYAQSPQYTGHSFLRSIPHSRFVRRSFIASLISSVVVVLSSKANCFESLSYIIVISVYRLKNKHFVMEV